MAILSKAQIFEADDKKTIEVSVPEWGGEVLIKTLSGKERDDFEASTVKGKGANQQANFENFRARFVAQCVVDENGVRLFASSHDVRFLGTKSVKALQRVFNAAQELNGMSQEDVDELTEGFEKEDEEDSTSDSPSDSVAPSESY